MESGIKTRVDSEGERVVERLEAPEECTLHAKFKWEDPGSWGPVLHTLYVYRAPAFMHLRIVSTQCN